MRKIYLFLVILLAYVAQASAEEFTRFIQSDDASHVIVWSRIYNNETYKYENTDASFEDGKWKVIMNTDKPGQIVIQAANGYKMTAISRGEKEVGSMSYYQYQYTDYVYEDDGQGDTYVVTTESIDMTGYITLEVDNPDAIEISMPDSRRYLSISEGTTAIGYTEEESTLQIKAADYDSPLYKCLVDGEEVQISGASYSPYYEVTLREIKDKVEVLANFPEGNAKYTLNVSGVDNLTDVVTSIYVNNESVPVASTVDVPFGKKIELEFDSDYKISIDGEALGSYQTIWDDIARADKTVSISAEPKPKFTVTLNVADASTITIYKDQTPNEARKIDIVDGINTFEYVQYTSFYIHQADGAFVSSVIVKNEDSESGYDIWYGGNSNSVSVNANITVDVTSKWIERDKQMVIYAEGFENLGDSFYGAWFDGTGQKINLQEGYNTILFCEDDKEAKVSYSTYSATAKAYKNGMPLNDSDGYGMFTWTPADGDVVKFFFNREPTAATVTFAGDATPEDYRVVADLITEVPTDEDYNTFANTELRIYPLTDGITVAAGEAGLELTTDERGPSYYAYTVTDDVTLTVSTPVAPVIPVPEHLYIFGTVDGNSWTPAEAIEMEKAENVFTYTGSIDAEGDGYFAFTEVQSSDWSEVNAARWSGSEGADQPVVLDSEIELVYGIDASLKLAQGTYKFTVTFEDYNVTLNVTKESSITGITADAASRAEYFNLQGIRVVNPAAGNIYIVRRGETVTKELVK